MAPKQPLHLANAKMFVGRQCAVNETTMACNLFILKPNPTIVYLLAYMTGPLNPFMLHITHMVALV